MSTVGDSTGIGGISAVEAGTIGGAGAGTAAGAGAGTGTGTKAASMVTEGVRIVSDGSLGVASDGGSSLIVVRSALVSTSIASRIGTGRSNGMLGPGGTVVSTTGEICNV